MNNNNLNSNLNNLINSELKEISDRQDASLHDRWDKANYENIRREFGNRFNKAYSE